MYSGVAPGGRTVTTVVKPSLDRNHLESHRVFGPGLQRGEGGQVAVLILGGMETSLDEVEDILANKRQKPFVQQRTQAEIREMCSVLAQRRDDRIRYWKKNPSEKPPVRQKQRTLYLPRSVRMVPTSVPGLRIREGA